MKYSNLLIGLLATVVLPSSYADEQTVPIGDSPFYYQIGGGDDFSLPPTMNSTTIHLKAETSLTEGSDCGVFKPQATFENYFNEGQANKLMNTIYDSAEGAVMSLPGYILSKTDPSLYNMMTNNLLGANAEFNLKTKSCNAMKQQINAGQNPYQDFATVSVNNQLKKQISLAKNDDSKDVAKTMSDISATGGNAGIPWVTGTDDGTGTKMAGGTGQPVVHVIQDTTVAGYNVLLDRDTDDTSSPSQNGNNAFLVSVWANPTDAATWMVQTIGDMNVTTCDGCDKTQTPGKGLRFWVEVCTDTNQDYCAKNISKKVADLVTGNEEINKANLLAVSAPGVIINEAVINAIKQMGPTTQSIVINKLGEEVSAQKVFNMAMLARRVLETGSEVPVIASDKPAQTEIHKGMKNLDDDIQSMTFEQNARKAMMSDTVTSILNYSQAQNAQSANNPLSDSNPAPIMHDGAIMENNK